MGFGSLRREVSSELGEVSKGLSEEICDLSAEG